VTAGTPAAPQGATVMAYSRREILVTGLKNAYALEDTPPT
jgi:hypothetical protein